MKNNALDTVLARKFGPGPANQHLRDLIDLAIKDIPHIRRGIRGKRTESDILDFFRQHYVKLNTKGIVVRSIFPHDLYFSTYEARIINYLIEPVGATGVLVLHGHSGVGKTTLLRYIIDFLYPSYEGLRNLTYPIYINMSSDDPSFKSSKDVLKYIQRRVYEESFERIYKYLVDNYKRILTEVHKAPAFSSWSRGNFPEREIENISKEGFDSFFQKLKESKKLDLILDALVSFQRTENTPMIIIIDDVDKYSSEIHSYVFKSLDSFARCGLYSVASMRTSSYRALDSKILQKLDLREGPIFFTMDIVREILVRSVQNAQKTVALSPSTSLSVDKLLATVTSLDLVNSFVDLISSEKGMKTLSNLSNMNLKVLFRKLGIIAQSTFFEDSYIARELLSRWAVPEAQRDPGARLWILLSLLLSNFHETFRTDPEMKKCGIINLYDCPLISTAPIKHFIHLHILGYLFRRRVSEAEYEYIFHENYDEVRSIYTLHKRLFNTENYDELFFKALLNLIESHLIYTESCSKFERIERNREKLMVDRICISGSGLFYLSNLLHKIEYIYFVKDDIDWIGDPRTFGLDPAGKDINRNQKFAVALRSMRVLMKLELEMLSTLCEKAERDNGRMLIDYRELFSGFYPHVGHNNVLVTDLFVSDMVRFVRNMLKDKYETSIAAKEEKLLESLRNENSSLIEAFAI